MKTIIVTVCGILVFVGYVAWLWWEIKTAPVIDENGKKLT